MTERVMWIVSWLLIIVAGALLALGITNHNAGFAFGAFFAAIESVAFAFGALNYDR